MRVNDVAKQLRVSPSTVRKYSNEGRIQHDLNPAGQRVYTQEQVNKFLGLKEEIIKVFYVRSSSGNKSLLQSQINELTQEFGEPFKVYSDNGSGLNENRVGLQKLLKDATNNKFTQVHVTYEDRLSRFGVSFIKQLLHKDNIKLIVLHDTMKYSLEEELMQALVENSID